MKTVSKKLLSLLLVAILLVSAIPFQAFAVEPAADEPAVVSDLTGTDAGAGTGTVTDAGAGGTDAGTGTGTDTGTYVEQPNAGAPQKEAHNENVASHVSGVWEKDATSHWKLCPNANCEQYGAPLGTAPHTFQNGACVTCGYACAHANQGPDQSTAIAADCVHGGKEPDTVCFDCKMVLKKGEPTPATGAHNFVNYICTVCGATQTGAAGQLTLDANGGTINGGASLVLNVNIGSSIGSVSDAVRPGYTFAGWWTAPDGTGKQVYKGAIYDGSYTTLYAKWTEVTYRLTVRRLLNRDYSSAKTVYEENVPAGTPLLAYLNNNVSSAVMQELNVTPGFRWESNFWRDYSGLQPLTSQADCMNQAQTIYVNFTSSSYTLYFNPNGGTLTTDSKIVYFGSAVGTLPIPYREGKVFQGWEDVNGVEYTANTVYKIAGDTTLTAKWQDEALVLLYVYINGSFSSCDRMIVMDQYVQNNNISRADVYAQVAKHYVPASGYLNIAGLFDEYTWGSYRLNTSKPGVENIQINGSRVNKIYVMVTNARTGSTVVTNPGGTITVPGGGTITIPQNSYWVATGSNTGYWMQGTAPQGSYWVSTGNGNGYWVYPIAGVTPSTPIYPTWIYPGTNPKTGDTSMIEAAAAVMVLAAAALVTIMSLRKKKMAK